MSQCNILSFTIMTQYYRKNWEQLCCWLPPDQTYDGFVTGLTQTYNESCLKDRVFSDYVTRLFNECLSGSSSDGVYVTGGTANGTNDTLVFTNSSGGTFTVANSALLFNDAYVSGGTLDSATGCVTFVNTSGGTFQVCGFDGFTSYWSANTYGIINSGLTSNVGIGTTTPNEKLTVEGSISASTDLYVSGDTALAGIVGITGKTYLGTVAAAGASYTNNEILVRSSTAAVEYLTIEQLKEDIADADLWTANTYGIINSGLTSNVGIGTATPNEKLTVEGSISASTDLYVSGDTSVAGILEITGKTFLGDQLLVKGGTTSASPTPQIKFSNYYDSTGGPSISHIDLYDGIYGFGISVFDFDYISDKNHRFYSDTTAATGGTPALQINGELNTVAINRSSSTSKALHVGGEVQVDTINPAGGGYTGDKILVSDGGVVEYLTTAELKQDIADADLWTANTYGIINSGLTAHVGIGTNTPNKPLTVLGDISGTTAIYLGDPEGGIFISGETQAAGDLSLHSNDDIEYYCGDDMVFNVGCKIKFTELTGITPSLQLELDGSGNGHGVCFIENGLDNHILAISTADTRLYFVDVGGEWISGDTTDLSIGSGNDIKLMPTTAVLIDTDKPIRWRDSGLAILSSTDGQLDIDADGELEITSPIVDIDASTGLDLAGANLNSTWTVNTTNKIQFRDSGLYIHSSVDGQLDIVTDTALLLTSPYVGVGNAATGPGEIRFYEDTDDGAHYAALKTGALGASYTLTLPTDDGDSGEVLSTDGNGVLSWASAGGGGTSYWTANTYGIVNSGLTTANVGIGTSTPNEELTVKGTISADTSILVGSNCIIKSPEANSVFIGDDAGLNWEATSNSNTAMGRLSMGMGTMAGAVQNTAFGFASLGYLTTGDYNTSVGLQANQATDTGSWNTAVGKTAMFSATYHSYNTALGANTMYFTTSGSLGKTVPTDTHNTAIGYSSQYYNLNGAFNTSVGSQSMGNSTVAYAGTGNTATGFKSLFNSTTGNYNVTIGYQAGDNITSGDYNISIGPNSDPPSATADYQMNIGGIIHGNDEYSESKIANVGIGYNDPKTVLDVHHSGNDLTSMAVGTGGGEVIYFGLNNADGETPLGKGKLMFLDNDFYWKYADANTVGTGGSQLLALGLGTTVSEGLLIRGFFHLNADEIQGTYDEGIPCYVSEAAGSTDFTQPTASTAFVRVIGYAISQVTEEPRVIYFNPDGTYITIA